MREGLFRNGTSMKALPSYLSVLVILLLIPEVTAQSGRRAKEIRVPVPPPPVEEPAKSRPAADPDDPPPATAEKNQDYGCTQDGSLARLLDDTGAEQIYSSKQVDVRVIIISKPSPAYTKEARRLGVQGYVTLKVLLSGNGKVTRIRVNKGLPAGLTENAIRAACKMKFKPALKDGQAVSQWVTAEYVFRLADSSIFGP